MKQEATISKRNIRRLTKKYISEKFLRDYGEFFVLLLEAHLGAGKTTSIEQFKHLKVLYISSSVELIEQICQRYKWLTSYIEEDGTTRKNKQQLRNIKRLAINYHSLHKLTQEGDIKFDVVIIDEPYAVWESSTTYKPNKRNEAEFIYRIQSTPKVVFMGADFPEFINDEIKTIIKNRPSELGTTLTELKYEYPIDSHIEVRFVYNQADRDMFINRHMKFREDRRLYLEKTPFGIKKSNTFELERNDGTIHSFYEEQTEWDKFNNTKGVLIVSEYGITGTENMAEKWRTEYPELNIVVIHSKNAKLHKELRDNFSDPDKYSGIDMLICSPSWSMGLNIVNEFDLVVGDFARNAEFPLTPREIYQSMHRERNPQLHIIQISKRTTIGGEWETLPAYSRETSSLEEYQRACKYFKFDISDYVIRQSDGSVKPDNELNNLWPRYIEVMRDNITDRAIRQQLVWNMYKKNGARIQNWEDELEEIRKHDKNYLKEEYKNLPKAQKSKQKERLLGLEEHNSQSLKLLEIAKESLGITEDRNLTKEESEIWDSGNYEANKFRHWNLTNFTQLDETTQECVSLVNRIINIEALMNVITNERILTSEMFYLSDIAKELKENKPRYEAILRTYLDTRTEIPAMTVKEKDKELLVWLEEILRKHYFKVVLSNGGCKADYKEAKKEHNADFVKWKKEYRAKYNPKGYLRYEDYLFIGLVDKTIKWQKLGTESRKFVESFPHLKITNYTWNSSTC